MENAETTETAATASATDHVVRIMNDAWLALALSFGERLGLLEALADTGPATTSELAATTGCDERYLTEWVWALVAGGLAETTDGVPAGRAGDETGRRFALREGYRAPLTPAGGPAHWSRITTQVAALATLEDQLVAAAAAHRGLPDTAYEGRIVDVLAAESGPIAERALLEEVLPLLGVADRLAEGGRVVDLGCGTGQSLGLLAARFPASTYTGVDQSADSLAAARRRFEALGGDVRLVRADLEDAVDEWEVDGGADLVIAANTAHDLSDPVAFFRGVRSLLAPGGVLLLHELGFDDDMTVNAADPHAVGVLVFGLYHCVPLARRRDGIAPGGMWGRGRWVAALHEAGFTDVRVERAPSDPNNDSIIARP
jgi:SAM-dependent methyltransferase